jgi:hypothetical protein
MVSQRKTLLLPDERGVREKANARAGSDRRHIFGKRQ